MNEYVNINMTSGFASVSINGCTYIGKTVVIENDIVYVNNKKCLKSNILGPVNITLNGDANTVSTVNGNINIGQNVNGSITSVNGNITVKGIVKKDLHSTNGNIRVNNDNPSSHNNMIILALCLIGGFFVKFAYYSPKK